MCYYCHNPRHVRRNCRRLQNKNRRFHSVHYQISLKFASTSITTLIESSKTNTFLFSLPPHGVIDFGATDHMTGNSVYLLRFSQTLPPLLLPLQMGQHLMSLNQGQFIRLI